MVLEHFSNTRRRNPKFLDTHNGSGYIIGAVLPIRYATSLAVARLLHSPQNTNFIKLRQNKEGEFDRAKKKKIFFCAFAVSSVENFFLALEYENASRG
jgi:hypothetical protein